MIKTTWDQGSPYNDLCPEDINGQRSLTGCVATATAQVMNYYQWPTGAATGTGSYTLELTKETGEVNLDGIIFDWENMADTYDGSTTTAQDSAVALLMYAVGPAVKMEYSYAGSGAELYDVPNALVNNFGYDLNVSYVKWDNHTNEEWYTILRTELEANRPIVYAGGGSVDEGHAFICDGYDANNAYHFNWGWSGEYDGYYKLSVLNPEYEFEIQEFVMNQEAVIGIRQPTEESQEYGALYCIGIDPDGDDEDDEDDEADIAQGGDLSFDLSLIYEGPLPSSDVELSIELYQNGGSVKALFEKVLDVVDDSLFVGTGIPVKIENLTLEEGSYEMKLFYRFVKEGPQHEMAYSSLAVWTDWGLYASKDSIQWINTVSKMSGTPISIEEQVDEDGDPVAWVISTTLQNEDTTRNIAPYIFLNIENFIYVEAGQVSLAAGEKASVQMLAPWQELDPGEYEVVLMYSDGNDGERIEGTESILYVNNTTAIEAVESQSLTVRQSGDRLLITSDDTLQAARLYDRSGRLVRTTKDTTVSVAGLSNGTYILQLETGKGTYVKKLSIH